MGQFRGQLGNEPAASPSSLGGSTQADEANDVDDLSHLEGSLVDAACGRQRG